MKGKIKQQAPASTSVELKKGGEVIADVFDTKGDARKFAAPYVQKGYEAKYSRVRY